MEVWALRVSKSKGEAARRWAIEKDIIDLDRRIRADGDMLFIPLTEDPASACAPFPVPFDTAKADFEELKKRPSSYREIITVPSDIESLLPRSFDIIGPVALMKLDEKLIKYADKIGEAIHEAHPSIKTVAIDHGVKSDYRIRDLRVVFGDEIGEIQHRENGISLSLDPSQVYFSPRLAGERSRVSKMVRDGENILDMFAGVGPFTILLANEHKVNIIANDLNSKAVMYLRKNIVSNNVTRIKAVNANASNIRLKGVNRIIMNLPQSAYKFLPQALAMAAPGGTIHYYEILDKWVVRSRAEDIGRMAKNMNRMVKVSQREIRTYSPVQSHYGFDISLY